MITNSIDFTKLKPNQELYMVRYSQKEHPDYTTIHFKYFDTSTSEHMIEFTYNTTKGEKTKKANLRKAEYRIFIDENEMAKALYDCFMKREIDIIDGYTDLFEKSQDNRPELWV